MDLSISNADDVYTSSVGRDGPTNDDSRICIWIAAKSWEDSPLTESTVKKNEILLPVGKVPGMGDDGLVDAADPLALRFGGNTTLTTFRSTRQDPMASAVYRQKIGMVEVDDNRRDKGARETRALPIKEKSGGGES